MKMIRWQTMCENLRLMIVFMLDEALDEYGCRVGLWAPPHHRPSNSSTGWMGIITFVVPVWNDGCWLTSTCFWKRRTDSQRKDSVINTLRRNCFQKVLFSETASVLSCVDKDLKCKESFHFPLRALCEWGPMNGASILNECHLNDSKMYWFNWLFYFLIYISTCYFNRENFTFSYTCSFFIFWKLCFMSKALL